MKKLVYGSLMWNFLLSAFIGYCIYFCIKYPLFLVTDNTKNIYHLTHIQKEIDEKINSLTLAVNKLSSDVGRNRNDIITITSILLKTKFGDADGLGNKNKLPLYRIELTRHDHPLWLTNQEPFIIFRKE